MASIKKSLQFATEVDDFWTINYNYNSMASIELELKQFIEARNSGVFEASLSLMETNIGNQIEKLDI